MGITEGINYVLIYPFNPDSVTGLCDYKIGVCGGQKHSKLELNNSLDQTLSVLIPYITLPSTRVRVLERGSLVTLVAIVSWVAIKRA